MKRHQHDDIDELLERARTERQRAPMPTAGPGGFHDPHDRIPGYVVRPNRHATRRRFSTFTIVLFLFGCGVAIILYINNILRVNQLAFEVSQLETQYNAARNTNAILQAGINRKSGWERITTLAHERAGLHHPSEQPRWFSIDGDTEASLREP